MKKRILVITTIVTLLFLCQSSFALDKVGQSGAQFLKLGVGARAIGMGGAFTAVANDASALYWNPAGLTNVMSKEFTFTHTKWVADINYEYAGYAHKLPGIGTIGLSMSALTMDDIEITTPLNPQGNGEYYTASDYMMALTFARMLTDKFSVGGTVKYIGQYIDDESANGFAVDVGTLYDTGFKTLRLAMSIQNFGGDMKFVEEEYPLPITFKFGVAMDVVDTGMHLLTTSVEMNHPNDNAEQVNWGVEYWFNNMFALRSGYKFNSDSVGLSAGLGAKVPISFAQLMVDYAYTDVGHMAKDDEFGENAHRISLGLAF
jgi:hypothetical protein